RCSSRARRCGLAYYKLPLSAAAGLSLPSRTHPPLSSPQPCPTKTTTVASSSSTTRRADLLLARVDTIPNSRRRHTAVTSSSHTASNPSTGNPTSPSLPHRQYTFNSRIRAEEADAWRA
ncbi:hypothetical protein C2E23DRAFT_903878, partial [Lenzites betulinus]